MIGGARALIRGRLTQDPNHPGPVAKRSFSANVQVTSFLWLKDNWLKESAVEAYLLSFTHSSSRSMCRSLVLRVCASLCAKNFVSKSARWSLVPT